MKKIYLLIVVMLVASFCMANPPEVKYANRIYDENTDVRVLKVKEKDIIADGALSDVIEVDSFLVLENTKNAFIGSIRKVIVTSEYIYVLDDNIAKALFCYDKKGHFINSYKKIGKGPDEYVALSDFCVLNNVVYLKGDNNRFFKLDKELNLITSIDIKWAMKYPPAFVGVVMKDEKTAVFSSHTTSHHFYYYDLAKQQITNAIAPVIGLGDIQSAKPLQLTKEKMIVATMRYNDTIFNLTPKGLLPYIKVDFEHAIPAENKRVLRTTSFISKGRPDTRNNMLDPDYFYETEEFITFGFEYKNREHSYMFDKKSGEIKIFANDLLNDLFGAKYFPFYSGFYKNSIIVPVEALDLISNKNDLKIEIPKSLTIDSNPVLVFFHPKFE